MSKEHKVVIFLGLCCLVMSDCDLYDKSGFNNWKIQHNKTYNNSTEESVAFTNYITDKNAIEKHNKRYDEGKETFLRVLNKYSDWSLKQKQGSLNGFTFNGTNLPPYENVPEMERAELPTEIDWRQMGYVGPVQDQGYKCASCWTFSALGALEGQIFKTTGKLHHLSEQYLIDCNKDKEIGNWGCNGGFMIAAYDFIMRSNGVVDADKYPYKEGEYPCDEKNNEPKVTLEQYVVVPPGNESILARVVARVGPVSVAIHGSLDSIYSYSSGVYFDPGCTHNINHAVLVVGYGTDPVFGDFWLVKNSWGANWGDNGYIKMARNQDNHCGISDYVVYPNL